MSFGKLVKEARDKMGLSQEEAAKYLEKKYSVRISASYLSMIENGSKTNLTINLLKAIYDFFNLPHNSIGLLLDKSNLDIKTDKKNIDILEALEDSNTTITTGEEPITREQRVSILRVLVNPMKNIKKSTTPVLGTIRAGIPLLADANYEGELEIPADIEADFALRTEGNSMIGVGIHEGDYAICREAKMPNSGQIVVALRDLATGYCEATLKFYFKENGRAILRAANPDFEDIHMEEGWRTTGVLVALLKKETPIYRVYNSYLAARDMNMDKWVPVLEKAFQAGLKPEQVKSVIEMIYQSSQK